MAGSTVHTYPTEVVAPPADLVSPPDLSSYGDPLVGNKLTNAIERLSDGPARQRCEFCDRLHGWRYGCDVQIALALIALDSDLRIELAVRGGRVGRAR